MIINGREIGSGAPPYVIAEMSANHNGNLDTAFRIIEEARRCGADALKIQTYRADTMTLDCDTEDFQIHGGVWDCHMSCKIYGQAYPPLEWRNWKSYCA